MRACSIRFPASAQGLSFAEKAVLLAVIAFRASTVPTPIVSQTRISFETKIVCCRIIEIEMQPSAFFSAQGRIDNQSRNSGQIPQLQEIDGNSKIPVKLANLSLQIPQPGGGALQSFVTAHDANLIPHQAADLVPVVIDCHQFINVLHVPRFPFRQ